MLLVLVATQNLYPVDRISQYKDELYGGNVIQDTVLVMIASNLASSETERVTPLPGLMTAFGTIYH